MEGTGNGGKRLDLPVLQYGQSKAGDGRDESDGTLCW